MVGLIISQPADLPDLTANVANDMFWFHSNVYKKILPLGGRLCRMIVTQQIRQCDTESCWGFDANVSGPILWQSHDANWYHANSHLMPITW